MDEKSDDPNFDKNEDENDSQETDASVLDQLEEVDSYDSLGGSLESMKETTALCENIIKDSLSRESKKQEFQDDKKRSRRYTAQEAINHTNSTRKEVQVSNHSETKRELFPNHSLLKATIMQGIMAKKSQAEVMERKSDLPRRETKKRGSVFYKTSTFKADSPALSEDRKKKGSYNSELQLHTLERDSRTREEVASLSLFMWGKAKGRLLQMEASSPVEVKQDKSLNYIKVAASPNNVSALTVEGNLYSWGKSLVDTAEDKAFLLGIERDEDSPNPTLILGPKTIHKEPIVQVAVGNYHQLALSNTGKGE